MKFRKWLKILLWSLTLLAITFLIILRRTEVFSWFPDTYDTYLIIIWVVLMLLPTLSEVEFFGIKFKREIDNLKTDINIKLSEIRNDIRVNQTTSIHNYLGSLPSEAKINIYKEKGKEVFNTDDFTRGVIDEINTDNIELFKVRLHIEKELTRIFQGLFKTGYMMHAGVKTSLNRQVLELNKLGIIDEDFTSILRDIISICNYAVHGEKITSQQIDFAKQYSEKVINKLKNIE